MKIGVTKSRFQVMMHALWIGVEYVHPATDFCDFCAFSRLSKKSENSR